MIEKQYKKELLENIITIIQGQNYELTKKQYIGFGNILNTMSEPFKAEFDGINIDRKINYLNEKTIPLLF